MRWLIYTGLAILIVSVIILLIGAALPKGHVASRKVILAAAPADVFALIAGPSDWRGYPYERVAESPLTWRETDPGGQVITYQRVETDAPGRIVNRIADPKLPFGGSWIYEIAPAGGGSELTITEHGEVYDPLFRFVSRFLMGHTATIEKYQRDVAARFGR